MGYYSIRARLRRWARRRSLAGEVMLAAYSELVATKPDVPRLGALPGTLDRSCQAAAARLAVLAYLDGMDDDAKIFVELARSDGFHEAVEKCPACGEPGHASEVDDDGYHAGCRPAAEKCRASFPLASPCPCDADYVLDGEPLCVECISQDYAPDGWSETGRIDPITSLEVVVLASEGAAL